MRLLEHPDDTKGLISGPDLCRTIAKRCDRAEISVYKKLKGTIEPHGYTIKRGLHYWYTEKQFDKALALCAKDWKVSL